MKFNPDDYTPEELQRLVSLGLQADIERALDRLPPEWRNGEIPFTEENARWLENYIKLNPGGICSLDKVTITRRKE